MIVNSLDQAVVTLTHADSIFLAGPVPADGSNKAWRNIEAIPLLEEMGFNGIVYVPEFSSSIQVRNRQEIRMWELRALYLAHKIVCWLPYPVDLSDPDILSPTLTNYIPADEIIEEYSDKILYGRPPQEHESYIDTLFHKNKAYDSLEELLKQAVYRTL